MKDKLDLSYLTIKPTKQEQNDMAKAICFNKCKLRYKRLKSGKYRVMCNMCGETYTVSAKEFNQMRASHLCNHCHRTIRNFTTITEENYCEYILKYSANKKVVTYKDYKLFGFYMVIQDKLGCKPKVKLCDHVLYFDGETRYRRNVARNMYCLNRTDSPEWKKIRPYTDYEGYFYCYETLVVDMESQNQSKSKKELYESYYLDDLKLKDNQKRLIMDNLYNIVQILFIKLFNLKKSEDLHKYRKYINDNREIWAIDLEDRGLELNEYYLHYLWKNKIKLSDFIDYIDQCDELGVKVDKPKNFQERHREYSRRIKILDSEKDNAKVKKMYKRYKKYGYKANDIEIKPFANVEEIINCGEILHNCIGGYVGRYANGYTAIFYLTEKGELKAAIEVKKGKLIQARKKFNEDCTKTQIKHIKKWLKQMGWEYA